MIIWDYFAVCLSLILSFQFSKCELFWNFGNILIHISNTEISKIFHVQIMNN